MSNSSRRRGGVDFRLTEQSFTLKPSNRSNDRKLIYDFKFKIANAIKRARKSANIIIPKGNRFRVNITQTSTNTSDVELIVKNVIGRTVLRPGKEMGIQGRLKLNALNNSNPSASPYKFDITITGFLDRQRTKPVEITAPVSLSIQTATVSISESFDEEQFLGLTTNQLKISLNKSSRAKNKVQFINFTNKLYQDSPITINNLIVTIAKRPSDNEGVQLNVVGAKPLRDRKDGKFIYFLPIVIQPNRTVDIEFVTTTDKGVPDKISEVFEISIEAEKISYGSGPKEPVSIGDFSGDNFSLVAVVDINQNGGFDDLIDDNPGGLPNVDNPGNIGDIDLNCNNISWNELVDITGNTIVTPTSSPHGNNSMALLNFPNFVQYNGVDVDQVTFTLTAQTINGADLSTFENFGLGVNNPAALVNPQTLSSTSSRQVRFGKLPCRTVRREFATDIQINGDGANFEPMDSVISYFDQPIIYTITAKVTLVSTSILSLNPFGPSTLDCEISGTFNVCGDLEVAEDLDCSDFFLPYQGVVSVNSQVIPNGDCIPSGSTVKVVFSPDISAPNHSWDDMKASTLVGQQNGFGAGNVTHNVVNVIDNLTGNSANDIFPPSFIIFSAGDPIYGSVSITSLSSLTSNFSYTFQIQTLFATATGVLTCESEYVISYNICEETSGGPSEEDPCLNKTIEVTVSSTTPDVVVSGSTTFAGAFTIQASGGDPAYQYVVQYPDGMEVPSSGGDNDPQTFTALQGGSYNIIVQDADSCRRTAVVSIESVDGFDCTRFSPVVTGVVTDESFDAAGDGAITITVTQEDSTGFNLSTSYLWSNGATTQNISNLSPGTYSVTVTVTDTATSSSCATTETFQVFPGLTEPTKILPCQEFGLASCAPTLTYQDKIDEISECIGELMCVLEDFLDKGKDVEHIHLQIEYLVYANDLLSVFENGATATSDELDCINQKFIVYCGCFDVEDIDKERRNDKDVTQVATVLKDTTTSRIQSVTFQEQVEEQEFSIVPERAEEEEETVEVEVETVVQTKTVKTRESDKLYQDILQQGKTLARALAFFGINLGLTSQQITENIKEVQSAKIDTKEQARLVKDLNTLLQAMNEYTRITGLIFPDKK